MATVVYVCWGAFVVAWGFGYVYNVFFAPRAVRRDLSITGWWPRLLLILALLFLLTRRDAPVRALAIRSFEDPTLVAIGTVLLVASTLFTLWARWTLGTMWTGVPTIKESHRLRTTGPYALTRNPIYTGILGMLVGTALVEGSLIIAAGALVFLFTVLGRIRSEEHLLRDTFGEEFDRYRASVAPLIPFVPWP
ncbi:MAG: isoprenylcysteine carboxylmethyltransferase family protein [Chloroflexota bacterium]|nr:isoprenylcysteine carboxylmethyltransferase family protein [Chloroflexota bacterium]